MRTPFELLQERVLQLGNHHRKYLRFIEANQNQLIERLEEKGLIEQVHLWSAAGKRFASEMRLIQSLGESQKQKLDFMGWFYSTQFLLMDLRAIDVLSLNLCLGENRLKVYRQFMKRIGWEFRHLTAVYMESVLRLLTDAGNLPEFAVLGVGTRADQDDIDLAIIDDGIGKRLAFNQAISQLQNEMIRHACRLHFYLAENIRTRSFSFSMEEYQNFLGGQSNDCIIVSELLSAALIFGSENLFTEFQTQVTDRYFYRKNQDNRFHEGYLRGILGEIRALLGRRVHSSTTIQPKDDALRIIKSLAYAGKCICGIHRVNVWDILDALSQHLPERETEYKALEDALSFFEIFRFLYQLYVVQEEEIYLDEEADFARMDLVAQAMGYQHSGAKKASDFLLVHYYENVRQLKLAAETLIEDYSRHLRQISSFTKVFHSEPDTQSNDFLEHFIETVNFFQGTKFWNDFFYLLDETDGQFLLQIVRSIQDFTPRKKQDFCRLLTEAVKSSYYSSFSLLVLVSSHLEKEGLQDFFERLNAEFFRIITEDRDRTWRIARIFNYSPGLVNKYLMSLTELDQQRFIFLLEDGNIYTRQDELAKDKMKYLAGLYFNTSRYFRRFYLAVINQYPQFIEFVDDPEQLSKFAKGLLGSVENEISMEGKKRKLNDSFYIDFFRIGITVLTGGQVDFIESEFTAFFCNYVQEHFRIAKQEVVDEMGEPLVTRDLLGIFVAGSLAREHAFEDDLDLIVLLNSNDEQVRAACTKVTTRMNREIIKQGIFTHYRFAEHFGCYVTLLSELENFFSQDLAENFVEKSQLLGARLIVGSSRFEHEFKNRILEPFIFRKKTAFVQSISNELRERHRTMCDKPEFQFNLKENCGGLRDIELVLLIFKAWFQLEEPVNKKLINAIQNAQPQFAGSMKILGEAFDFLRHLRNVYRTVVAAKNTLDPAYLDRPAKIIGVKDDRNQSTAAVLLEKYFQTCRQSTEIIQSLLEQFRKNLELS